MVSCCRNGSFKLWNGQQKLNTLRSAPLRSLLSCPPQYYNPPAHLKCKDMSCINSNAELRTSWGRRNVEGFWAFISLSRNQQSTINNQQSSIVDKVIKLWLLSIHSCIRACDWDLGLSWRVSESSESSLQSRIQWPSSRRTTSVLYCRVLY